MRTTSHPYVWQLVIAVMLLAGCNQAEVAKLRSQNAELESQVNELQYKSDLKDSTINDFFKDFNDIEANLNEIKKKEQGLVSKRVANRELAQGDKERIISDITAINELLIENKRKIQGLSSKLKDANVNITEFERMLSGLEESLEQKNMEIDQLRTNLANANDALSALNDLYIESVMEAEAKQEELNRAYYAFGTFKELKENNVLTKEGGLIGIGSTKTLKDDFNKAYFKEVDISIDQTLKLYSDKAKIVTTHPSDSYELKMVDNQYQLQITKHKAFWSASKYLVIITD